METNKRRTSGKWEIDTDAENNLSPYRIVNNNGVLVAITDTYIKWDEEKKANAAFIVKCVNNYEELIRQNEEMTNILRSIADDYDSLKSINSNPNHTAIAIASKAKKYLEKASK